MPAQYANFYRLNFVSQNPADPSDVTFEVDSVITTPGPPWEVEGENGDGLEYG